MKTIKTKNYFNQICVWPACVLNKGKIPAPNQIKEFETWMQKEFKTKVKFLEEVKTNPDKDTNGNPVSGTGNRIDLFFVIHDKDIGHFAVPRIPYGIRWWEDVLGNGGAHLYSKEILKKYKPGWNTKAISRSNSKKN